MALRFFNIDLSQSGDMKKSHTSQPTMNVRAVWYRRTVSAETNDIIISMGPFGKSRNNFGRVVILEEW
jgi:hypothetical protein